MLAERVAPPRSGARLFTSCPRTLSKLLLEELLQFQNYDLDGDGLLDLKEGQKGEKYWLEFKRCASCERSARLVVFCVC